MWTVYHVIKSSNSFSRSAKGAKLKFVLFLFYGCSTVVLKCPVCFYGIFRSYIRMIANSAIASYFWCNFNGPFYNNDTHIILPLITYICLPFLAHLCTQLTTVLGTHVSFQPNIVPPVKNNAAFYMYFCVCRLQCTYRNQLWQGECAIVHHCNGT